MLRRTALASLALVGSLVIVASHKHVQIGLHLIERGVEGLSEGDRVKLVLDDLVEPLGAAIGLRVTHFRARVLNVIQMQEELIRVLLKLAAVLGSAAVVPRFCVSSILSQVALAC